MMFVSLQATVTQVNKSVRPNGLSNVEKEYVTVACSLGGMKQDDGLKKETQRS